MTTVEGDVDAAFADVRDVFADVIADRTGSGAALAVWHDSRWVVDVWGGSADANRQQAWRRDSIAQPYSVSKPFTAVAALMLVDRGVLDLDAPMQRYWPEFRAPATVRQVLSHQAGVVLIEDDMPADALFHWSVLCAELAAQYPMWEPGTACGESALFFGHLAGELVRRVDGRPIGQFLREDVCRPFGIEFAVGLDESEQARAVTLTGLDDTFIARTRQERGPLYERAISNPPGALDAAVVNGSAWRRAEIPAVNGHGSARGVALLYARLEEGRLLSRALLDEATHVQCSGFDRVMGQEASFGLGFALDTDGYGMGGLGGSLGWASTAGGYAIGYVTGHMESHDTATLLENAVRRSLGLPALT